MKIIKVLVDEAPEACEKCSLHRYRDYYCMALEVDTYAPHIQRLDDCPLVSDGEEENHDAA